MIMEAPISDIYLYRHCRIHKFIWPPQLNGLVSRISMHNPTQLISKFVSRRPDFFFKETEMNIFFKAFWGVLKELVIPPDFPKFRYTRTTCIPEIINPFVNCGNSPPVEIVSARSKGKTGIGFPHNHQGLFWNIK